ncbi:MAG: qseC [Gammaproteobacteria bacterium]|jgi:two-component system sensor histidine kinase QseC|nr:qseC [Gammaproteobacteria bacterium]
MTRSIRKFLLINLLLAVAVMTTLTTLGNLLLNDQEIQQQLDTELFQDNIALQTLTNTNSEEFATLRNHILEIPNFFKDPKYFEDKNAGYKPRYVGRELEFQIWDINNKLLVRSKKAPLTDISKGQEGFSNVIIDGEPWRVFATLNPNNGNRVIFAERYTIREIVSKRLMKNDVLILLISYPLFGLLIWGIVGRGLRSLKRVTEEVAYRESTYLEPVALKEVPEEIVPLVDELNKLFLRLQEAIEREKRFSADAAHELRTPLAALRTQVQVALRTEDPKQLKNSLLNIIAAVDRSSHVVQQLLTLSRMNPDAAEEDHHIPLNLVAIATESVSDLALTACNKDIDIELISPENEIIIRGNATALHILLRNLIDNAIRYIPEKGKITVKLTRTYEEAVLQVIDNGPGIPAALRSRVFERFYRIIGNKSPGSGLGLAIVQQITALHKGNVTLGTPENGIGLMVTVTFAIHRELAVEKSKSMLGKSTSPEG